MHYITNIEADVAGDTAKVRAMFYNPMQLAGMAAQSSCGGYYFHDLVRTAAGLRSRHLREDNVWFVNRPDGLQDRQSVDEGKRVDVRVDMGGGRTVKKKN